LGNSTPLKMYISGLATSKMPPSLGRRAWVIEVLITLANTMGLNVLKEKSRRKISRAKSTPAMGALKIAAIPPATPQATSVFMWWRLTPIACPKLLPMAAPIWTIGPSVPADPPEPMVSALDTALANATRGRMTPPLR
jgi:hypothetical protein